MSDVRDFGAMGDGEHDDLAAFEHCLRDGDGMIELPPGDYRLSKPLVVRLAETGRGAIVAMMEAAGFARCDYRNLSAGIVAIHTGYKV